MSSITVTQAATLVAFGALEGASFYFSGLYNPNALYYQMSFKTLAMLKFFVSAVGGSMIAQAYLNYTNPNQFDLSRVPMNVGWARPIIGCAIMGAGVTLSGAGPSLYPGMIVTVKNSHYTILGAVAGGVLFAALEKMGVFQVATPVLNPSEALLDKKYGFSYTKVAAIVGSVMVAGSFAVESFWPHTIDRSFLGSTITPYLLPSLGGLAIGLSQIPLRNIINDGAGAATSIMNVIGTLTNGALSGRHKLSTAATSAGQIVYMFGGTLLGAYLASSYAPEGAVRQAFSPERSFVGGLLCLFGARVATGCLCGTGISAFGAFDITAIPATAAIFGGGMAAALFV